MKILITLFAVFGAYSSSFSQVSLSKWQSQPIVIDGIASDWYTNPRFFNAESNVHYEFRNDAQNLYLILKTTDRATQFQFLRAGFNVRFKVKSKPPMKCSITFPAHKADPMQHQSNNIGASEDKLVEKSALKLQTLLKDTAIVEGFQLSNGIICSDNKVDSVFCFAKNKNNIEQVLYELKIPLREFYGRDFLFENINTIPIQIQVVINDLSQGEINNMKNSRARGMSHGMRGEMGGGMGGGNRELSKGMGGEMGGDREMGERPPMPESGFSMSRKSFNIDFNLSSGK